MKCQACQLLWRYQMSNFADNGMGDSGCEGRQVRVSRQCLTSHPHHIDPAWPPNYLRPINSHYHRDGSLDRQVCNKEIWDGTTAECILDMALTDFLNLLYSRSICILWTKKEKKKENVFSDFQRRQTCVQINTLLIYKEAQRLTHASWQSSRQIIWITVRTHMSTAYSLQQESVVLNQEPNKSHLGLYFLTQYYQKNGLRRWLLFLWISRLCFMFHPYSQAINREWP